MHTIPSPALYDSNSLHSTLFKSLLPKPLPPSIKISRSRVVQTGPNSINPLKIEITDTPKLCILVLSQDNSSRFVVVAILGIRKHFEEKHSRYTVAVAHVLLWVMIECGRGGQSQVFGSCVCVQFCRGRPVARVFRHILIVEKEQDVRCHLRIEGTTDAASDCQGYVVVDSA